MNLEQQCVSLEMARKLRELGIKQQSLFYWVKVEIENVAMYGIKYIVDMFDEKDKFKEIYSAFTAAELGEMLPYSIKDEDGNSCYFIQDKFNECHRVSFADFSDGECSPYIEVKGETEANIRAKMLIHLIKIN